MIHVNRMQTFSQLVSVILLAFIQSAAFAMSLGDRGAFRVTFTAGELFSEAQAAEYGDILPMNQVITWELYVPASYDAARPAGVLTYVSPTRSGRIPEVWKPVLAEQNLIWISANKSGNGAGSLIRSIYAILGTGIVRNAYTTDDARLYVSGFSGGGRMASILMQRFSHLYTGAIYICGVNYWDDDLSRQNKELMRSRRHVFLTGTKDFNYRDTLNVLQLYNRSGLRHYELAVIEGMGHRLPDPPELAAALRFLDAE